MATRENEKEIRGRSGDGQAQTLVELGELSGKYLERVKEEWQLDNIYFYRFSSGYTRLIAFKRDETDRFWAKHIVRAIAGSTEKVTEKPYRYHSKAPQPCIDGACIALADDNLEVVLFTGKLEDEE